MVKIIRMKNHPASAPAPPSLRAVPLRQGSNGKAVPLLDEAQRETLAGIATLARFPRGARLEAEGERAVQIYNIIEGVVKTYRLSEDGAAYILAFLFPGDLVGLYENGRYVNSAEAVTQVVAHRLPIDALEQVLQRDPALNAHFLSKACHDLRAAQRHTILLAHHDARTRVLLFLDLIADHASEITGSRRIVALPMPRTDVADYLALSPEAVSRTLHALEHEGVLRFISPRVIEFDRRDDLPSIHRQSG
jgi:CRP/FNR family transcriptional regulator